MRIDFLLLKPTLNHCKSLCCKSRVLVWYPVLPAPTVLPAPYVISEQPSIPSKYFIWFILTLSLSIKKYFIKDYFQISYRGAVLDFRDIFKYIFAVIFN